MKIAFLLGSLNRGGLETLILDVLNNHSKAKFDMMCVHRKDGAYSDDFKQSGVSTFQLRPKGLFDLCYYTKLRKLLIDNKVDIVHAQTALDTCLARIATWGTKIKIVSSYHGFSFKVDKLMSLSLKWADLNIFVSCYQKQVYEEVYKLNLTTKNTVVYNGINFEKILDATHPIIDFIAEGRTQNRLQICMVGNFVRVREQNTVCRFLKLLSDEDISFDFYFIGKKDKTENWRYDECVEYCEKNNLLDSVHFLGGRGDVPAILQQVDAFVYSTDHDTFGIAVIEAIAAGLPTFVNDWEVMSEVTHNGEFAEIYKTKNEADLLMKFQEYLLDRDQMTKKYKENAKKIQSIYSIQNHMDNLYSNYQRVLNNK